MAYPLSAAIDLGYLSPYSFASFFALMILVLETRRLVQDAIRQKAQFDEPISEYQPLNAKPLHQQVARKPHLRNFHEYQQLYEESIRAPETFWAHISRGLISFERDFDTIYVGSFLQGTNAWFPEGRLNACFNCVDRHAFEAPSKTALIYEADEPGQSRIITYGQLLRDVSQLAWVLRRHGIGKGDTVTIYMPNCAHAVVAMLACARLGAIHSVVFSGFSSAALGERLRDARSKVVLTADQGCRGGKPVPTKHIVDQALQNCPLVKSVLVYRRTGAVVDWVNGRDFWWHEETLQCPSYIPSEPMGSEDPLFLLYTSGSTGKPKGILHATAGYLIGAAATGKYTFDLHDNDHLFCSADIGWITGHTYTVYAPLLLGCTTTIFEGTPTYPGPSRYWDIVDAHGITHFCAAPTALRVLKTVGDSYITSHSMKSLRMLCTAGEPIAPDIWAWYHATVGKGKAAVINVRAHTQI